MSNDQGFQGSQQGGAAGSGQNQGFGFDPMNAQGNMQAGQNPMQFNPNQQMPQQQPQPVQAVPQAQNMGAMGGGMPQAAQAQAQGSGNSTGYVFGQWADDMFKNNPPKIDVPEHPNTTFDVLYFLRCLAGSISLLWQEKAKIIESVPKLSQYQIDELCRILEEEKVKFQELSKEHGDQLEQLEKKHLEEFRQIEFMYAEDDEEDQTQDEADQIRKNLGLN